jgi:catechol-2,3-dioxygenase
MPTISSLGHVGLYCTDLPAQVAFYTGVLGLTKTDEDTVNGLVFLSAQPEQEHHELLLVNGRNAGRDARVVQQISFRCASLEDVTGYYRRFLEEGVPLDMVVSHGNAVGVYFFDPEGNRGEVYWQTGLAARQPYVQAVDLEADPEAIIAAITAEVALHGEHGIVDRAALARQDIGGQP